MNSKTKKQILFICQAGIIAALYTVLTLVSAAFGLASHEIQVRISEALSVLPLFTPAAIPGLTLGCMVSNLITGCMPLDVVFMIEAVGIFSCEMAQITNSTFILGLRDSPKAH